MACNGSPQLRGLFAYITVMKKQEMPYIRVGTDYFKIINQPLSSGDSLRMIKPWTKTTIREDHTNSYLSKIPKYDGFCCIPSHLHYQAEVKGFYNEYREFKWTKPVKAVIPHSQKFLSHIFGDQYNQGMDYLKLLLERPTQRLPILCLVSQERNTGKTTFLNWLKEIFDANMTINTNEDFESQFNSDWTSKLIIAVDEAFFDRKETSERIKNLSTTRTFKAEAKNKDKKEVEFFGKFILCSNNEDNFIKIDDDEIRYWIRKIPQLSSDDVNLLKKLKDEIPALIHHLINHKYTTQETSRMWFSKEQIWTEALDKVVKKNRSFIDQELKYIIEEKIEDFGLDEISFSISDLYELLKQSSLKCSKFQLKEILKEKWEMEPRNSSYESHAFYPSPDGGHYHNKDRKKGRHYTFTKAMFNDGENVTVDNTSNTTVDIVDTI